MFALIPVITGDSGWEAYIDTTLEQPQIEISGWCRHWLPYRVAVNCKDRTRDSGLTQVADYTCGPLTVVKFVDALFRLSLRSNVKFTGPRAKQRIMKEKWNTLGNSIPFVIPFGTENDNHVLEPSWEQSWNSLAENKGKKKVLLVTDEDCINYITEKLLWTWTDQVANTELNTGLGIDKFVVTNFPKEFDMKTGQEDCMKELTNNFVNKKTVDCEIAGNNKEDNDPLSTGSLPPIGKKQQQGENRTDHQGKTDASMSDGTKEQSKSGGSFSPTDQNDQMSGLLEAVAAALKGRAAGDDSRAGQEAGQKPNEPPGEQTEHPKGDDSPAGPPKPIEPPGEQLDTAKGDDSPAGQDDVSPAGEEQIDPPKGDDSPAGPPKPIEHPEETIELPKGDDSRKDQVEGYTGELDRRRSKGKKQQNVDNDKEGKLPAKKRPYDLHQETPAEKREKKERYPLRETPKRKENSDRKNNPKQIRKKRPLDADTQGGNKGEESQKEKPELPLFSKRRKKDLLDQYISLGLTKPETVPIRMTYEQRKKMYEYVDQSLVDWEWHTQEQHTQWLEEQQKLVDNAISESYKKAYEIIIDNAKKERKHAIRLFENEFKFTNMATIRSLKYNESRNTFRCRLDYASPVNVRDTDPNAEIEVPLHWIEQQVEPWFIHAAKKYSVKKFRKIPPDMELKVKMVGVPVARVKYAPEHTRMGIDVAKLAEMEEKQRKKAISSKKRVIRELESEPCIEGGIPKTEYTVAAQWRAMTSDGQIFPVCEDWVREQFSDQFVKELKKNYKGFWDVPVGDYKESHLWRYPHLIVHGAPKIKYQQKDEMNLCVPNALASVLHELGFTEEAITIHEYGLKQLLYSPAMDAINMIFEKAKEVLPKWLRLSKFPNKKKNIKLSSEEVTAIILGVLETSDGHRSHAVAVHGGYIYDANETIAIPCTKEGLDYCTSTPTKDSKFLYFRRGIKIYCQSQDKRHIEKMTRPPADHNEDDDEDDDNSIQSTLINSIREKMEGMDLQPLTTKMMRRMMTTASDPP